MNTEYWDNWLVKIMYSLNAIAFIGLPVGIIIQGKSDKIPILVFVFMFSLGTLFLRAAINSFKYPAYKIDHNKLYIRNLIKSEDCIEPNHFWSVTGDKDQIHLSKDKKIFTIQRFNLGKNQFSDLIEKLGKIADENSNQSLHTDGAKRRS